MLQPMKWLKAPAAGFLLLCLLSVGCFNSAEAQKRGRSGPKAGVKMAGSEFLNTQWFIGLKLGVNGTNVTSLTAYSAFTDTDQVNDDAYLKEYDKISSNLSTQIGANFTYRFLGGLSLSFQPTFASYSFGYVNTYAWANPETPDNSVKFDHAHKQKLNYLELPLLVKYELATGNTKPFIHVGGFYGRRIKADKTVEISMEDRIANTGANLQTEEQRIGNEEQFIKSNVGLLGGIGVSHDLGNIRFALDCTYKHGFFNVTDAKNRYQATQQLYGFGHVQDDISLQNVEINFSMLFPLKFLVSSNFKASL